MEIYNTKFKESKIFIPKVYNDDRGFFMESFNETITNTLKVNMPQSNHSKSKKYVLRGLHYQWDKPMGKLVRVVKGKALDVLVDLRKNSPTLGQYNKVLLTEENFKILWVPPGFAHGILILEDDTHVVYKTSSLYNEESEGSINPLDSTLNIDWGINTDSIILSTKDQQAQSFISYTNNFKFEYES